MNHLQIEIAETDDIPALVELLNTLFSQEKEFAPDNEKQTEGLKKIINYPEKGIILLAKQDKKIIGMVNLLLTVSTAMGKRVALLEDMVVSPDCRHKGIGSKLLTEAISLAKKNDCGRITLLTDKTNKMAHNFYKKQGFKESTMIPLRLALH